MFQDFSAEFMAKYRILGWVKSSAHTATSPRRSFHHVFHMVEGVKVRSTNAASQGANKHLSRGRDELCYIRTEQLLVSSNDSAHGDLPNLVLDIVKC